MAHPGGRPSKYNDSMVVEAKKYLFMCKKDGVTPYIEELASVLDVDTDTITNWAKKHKEFFGAIKRIKDFQRLRLLRKSEDKETFSPGQLFQLKANHGMIETEKKVLAGSENEPIKYENLSDDQLYATIKQTAAAVGID